MTTVGELLKLYERGRGGRIIDTRITYFDKLSREFLEHYLDMQLTDVDGKMTPAGFHSASCNDLRFKSFRSGLGTKRYTLMVSRDGSPIAFE